MFHLHDIRIMQRHNHRSNGAHGFDDISTSCRKKSRLCRSFMLFIWNCTIVNGTFTFGYVFFIINFENIIYLIFSLILIFCTGVLIDFISIPVTVGFTSATSVIIAASQLKGLLGLKYTSKNFLDNMKQVYLHIHETRLADTLLGCGCIVILLLLRVSFVIFLT